MIVKSLRVPHRRAGKLVRYLEGRGENEGVEILRGRAANAELAAEIARLAGSAYALRHVIVSPSQLHGAKLIDVVLDEISNEYGASDALHAAALVVRHSKRRAGGVESDHLHIVFGEYDTGTGRVLDSRFTRIRDEKISRILELRLGEPITPGRFNRVVFDRISSERPELALFRFRSALEAAAISAGMDPVDWKSYQAHSAYSTSSHQRLKRQLARASQLHGIDPDPAQLPEIRRRIRSIASRSDPVELVHSLKSHGFDIEAGTCEGTWRLTGQGVDLGDLARMSGIDAALVGAVMTLLSPIAAARSPRDPGGT